MFATVKRRRALVVEMFLIRPVYAVRLGVIRKVRLRFVLNLLIFEAWNPTAISPCSDVPVGSKKITLILRGRSLWSVSSISFVHYFYRTVAYFVSACLHRF